MEEKDLERLLESVKSGNTSIEDAVLELKKAPFEVPFCFCGAESHKVR